MADVCGECRAAMVGARGGLRFPFKEKNKTLTEEEKFLNKGTTRKLPSRYELHNMALLLLTTNPEKCIASAFLSYEYRYTDYKILYYVEKSSATSVTFIVEHDEDRKNVRAEMTYDDERNELSLIFKGAKNKDVTLKYKTYDGAKYTNYAGRWIEFFTTQQEA